MTALQTNEISNLFGKTIDEQKEPDDFMQAIEKANSQSKLKEENSPTLRIIPQEQPRTSRINTGLRKLSDPVSDTKAFEGLTGILPKDQKDIDFDVELLNLDSQINDTNLLNDLKSIQGRQQTSVKKMLRLKLKKLREENSNLKTTLKQM